MNKLSVIILTHNDESKIADCMDSVSFADEIIVVDDSSVDRTKELSKHLGARVYEFTETNFAEKRNFGSKRAKYKWVLYIDSDERVTPELQEQIKDVLKLKKPDFGGYRLQRKNFYFGNYEWPKIEKLERLFDRDAMEGWHGNVHETAIVHGNIGELSGFLNHYTHQNLASMVEKTIDWSKIEAELRYNSNHPRMSGWRFFRVMLTAFSDSYIKQQGWKAGTAGLVESIYQAFSMFITYARLWELQIENKQK
jgi:glycosyltransferase involved in cell wall biosynthesis